MTKTVLVADDDPAILDSVKGILEDEGYIVETSVDGKTVQAVNSCSPDMVLLDIWMSGVDGRDIARELRARDATKDIPIVMISANKDAEKTAMDSGANEFLAKPFDIDVLLGTVGKYVGEGA